MAANDPPCEPEKHDNTHAPIYDSRDDEYVQPNITEEFVRKQTSSMSVGKTTYPASISVKIIKIASPYITKCLTHYI